MTTHLSHTTQILCCHYLNIVYKACLILHFTADGTRQDNDKYEEKTKVLKRGNQKSIHWEPNLNFTVGFDLV